MYLIQREEREPITIGTAPGQLAATDLSHLEAQWRAKTGKASSAIFDYGLGLVRPKNWIGVMASTTTTLQVSPRGASELSPESRQLLDRNLGQMLQVAITPETHSLSLAQLSATASWLESAVEAFCDAVLMARRKGILRTYRARSAANPNARGSLVFPNHELHQIIHPASFFSHWVEFDENRAENRFLKSVLDFCAHRTSGRVRRRVQEVTAEFDRVSASTDPKAEHRNIRFERLPREYVHAISLGQTPPRTKSRRIFYRVSPGTLRNTLHAGALRGIHHTPRTSSRSRSPMHPRRKTTRPLPRPMDDRTKTGLKII